MKTLLVLLFLSLSIISKAARYYINPSSDSTKEYGTISNPWKSVATVNASMKMFKPGDTIFLKRGELFFHQLKITCSGKENAPIVFMTYGSAAAKPVFLYKGEAFNEAILVFKCRYIIVDGFEITDDNLDGKDHDKTANVIAGVSLIESDFITIKNINISLVGVGVNLDGNRNKIDNCRISNLKLIRNTVGGSDDYGANGIVMAGSDNIISNCFFQNCWGNSFDYTYYGGIIKMIGSTFNDNNKIINNTAINSDGFMEVVGSGNASYTNNLISHNTIINCGELIYLSNAPKSNPVIHNLLFAGNYVINSINKLPNPPTMIGIKTTSTSKGMIRLQHNIFWLASGMDVVKQAQVSEGQFIHRNNIYYLSGGELNFKEHSSELVLNKDAELIKQLALKHPLIPDMDLYPFIYLVKSMKKFIL